MIRSILLTLIFTFCLCVEAQGKRPVQIVFIGNSITQGARLANPELEGPAPQTRDILKERGFDVSILNCGLSGTTTVDWLPDGISRCFGPLIETTDKFFRPEAQHLFSVMLGTNDSAETTCNGAPVSPERYVRNVSLIVDTLLSRYPDSQIILNYPIWYSPSTYNGARYLQSGLNRLKSYHPMITLMVANGSERLHAGIPEAYNSFENHPELFDEESGNAGKFYLHPNRKGAHLLATFWADAIETVLHL